MIKVSVILPVYNTEKYLRQCLESIEHQTLKEMEVFCVDDGSSDGSVEIIREYVEKDSRFHLLEQKNAGGGAARNHGMKEAQGEYLLFLDSDDFFEPCLLERMAERLDETQADISVCKVRCWHEDLQFFTDEHAAMREEYLPEKEVFDYHDMPEYIFNTFHNWPWNKMFRRSFVEEKKLCFQEIRRTNDLFFTCSALVNAEKITTVKEFLVNYRVGITGNCQSTNTATPLDFHRAFSRLREYLLEKGCYEEVKRSFINHAIDGCVANLLSQEKSVQQETLYHQLKGGLFKALDIADQPADYYYDYNQRMYHFYRTIMDQDYDSLLRLRIQDLKDERDNCLHLNHIEKMGIIHRDEDRIRQLEAEKAALEREKMALEQEKEDLRAEKAELQYEVQNVYESFSYKAGHLVTSPLRVCARAARKAVNTEEKHNRRK